MSFHKKSWIFFSLCFIMSTAMAQDYKLMDSLRKAIATLKDDDSMKAFNLSKLAFEYSYVNLDSGMSIAVKALR
jgi:hypothetical protein